VQRVGNGDGNSGEFNISNFVGDNNDNKYTEMHGQQNLKK